MNEIENEIIKFLRRENKIIFDIGCFRGNFTSNFIKREDKLGYKSTFYMFDPNPRVKDYLRSMHINNKINYFNIALDNTNSKKKFYLNNFFEPSGSSLSTLILDDKKWVKTRKFFMKIFQPFKKIEDFIKITVETKTLDLEIGGMWLYAMVSPKNEKTWCKADYKEIETNKLLSWLDAFCDENGNENTIKPRSLWTNLFTEKNDITLVDITLKHDKLEDIETLIEMGFKEGFGMALLNLDQLLLTKNKKQ